MKALVFSVVAAGIALGSTAYAAPVPLTKEQMDKVVAGQGGQQNFAPGQFPAGNPAKAPGNSNPTPPR